MTISELSKTTTDHERQEVMMTERTGFLLNMSGTVRRSAWMILMATAFLAFGCGGDSHQTGAAAKYPAGISEDIEQQLKYDARVESFEPNGEELIVNVNDSWLHSPPGMRERALGQWYSLWQPAHSSASKIVVKFDGNEVETWTAEKGYQPVTKEETKAAAG
jgi:hypothetical protein